MADVVSKPKMALFAVSGNWQHINYFRHAIRGSQLGLSHVPGNGLPPQRR